ncbi:hypothetical protein C8J57DRAFT_1220252 [Mycena rebaudengoi]|nr:hypothetical protein C8J57DRAFT_1220252 [Mycena rebaudengoi]
MCISSLYQTSWRYDTAVDRTCCKKPTTQPVLDIRHASFGGDDGYTTGHVPGEEHRDGGELANCRLEANWVGNHPFEVGNPRGADEGGQNATLGAIHAPGGTDMGASAQYVRGSEQTTPTREQGSPANGGNAMCQNMMHRGRGGGTHGNRREHDDGNDTAPGWSQQNDARSQRGPTPSAAQRNQSQTQQQPPPQQQPQMPTQRQGNTQPAPQPTGGIPDHNYPDANTPNTAAEDKNKGKKTMKAAIQAAVLNISGHGNLNVRHHTNKWNNIWQMMRDQKIGVLITGEAHLDDQRKDNILRLFDKFISIEFSKDPHTANAAGIAFVLNKRLVKTDNLVTREVVPGRALILEMLHADGTELSILGVYAPNLPSENEKFWKDIKAWYIAHPRIRCPDILGGDTNIVEDPVD